MVNSQKSQSDFESILDLQREMVCRFLPDTTLTYVNQAYCRSFKKTKADLIGRKFLDFIPKEEQSGVLKHLEILALKGNPVSYIHKVIKDTGEMEWHEWTDYIVSRKDGVPTEFQSIGIDVTHKQLTLLALDKIEKSSNDLLRGSISPENLQHLKLIMDETRMIKDRLSRS